MSSSTVMLKHLHKIFIINFHIVLKSYVALYKTAYREVMYSIGFILEE